MHLGCLAVTQISAQAVALQSAWISKGCTHFSFNSKAKLQNQTTITQTGPDQSGVMQLAALECADEVDHVAQQIGAVNTLVRQSDGSLKGYNTDWSAAITAIENGLQPDSHTTAESTPSQQQDESTSSQHSSDSVSGLGAEEATTSGRVFNEGQGERQNGSVLKGRTVVVIGAGGAGKALAFGAAHKGAIVIIANRSVSCKDQQCMS